MTGLTPRDCRRHARAFIYARILMRPTCFLFLGYHGERIPRIKGPVFVLSNHNTDLDCVLLGLSGHGPYYYVATETIARMGLAGKLLMHFFNPILHSKGTVGAVTVRSILSRLHEGKSVALFPEGNRSFNGQTCPIPPATGKLARSSGATLVTYRFTGSYLTTPRWGRGFRRGRIRGKLQGVYSPETLRGMTPQQVQAAIERDLWTDAYEEQARDPVRFRSRHGAEYLESMLFLCPSCWKIGTLSSKGNRLSCTCGLSLRYTPYGYLENAQGEQSTITHLDEAQRAHLAELARENTDAPLFSDPVHLLEVDASHAAVREQDAVLTAYADRLQLGVTELPLDGIEDMSIVQRNRLLLYPAGSRSHYELTGAPGFSALKYLYLFRLSHPSVNGGL